MASWYSAIADRRLTKEQAGWLARGACPCGGDLMRVAYRDTNTQTRRWTAFGYTCSKCGIIYVEAGK